MILENILFSLIILFMNVLYIRAITEPRDFQMPVPKFMAYQNGGLNITIDDEEGIKQFSFYGSINREYKGTSQKGKDIIATTKEKWNNLWVIHVDRKFEIDEGIYYMYFVRFKDVGFLRDDLRTHINTIYDTQNNIVESKPIEDDPNCPRSSTRYRGKSPCRGKLIFSEEFDGEKIASKRWQVEKFVAQNPDFQFVTYNEDNLCLKNNNLIIKPTFITDENYIKKGTINFDEDCTRRIGSRECKFIAKHSVILPPINSSRIITNPQFTFLYGKIEFRAKLPEGDWIYPEFFLLPKSEESRQAEKIQRIVMGFVAGNENLAYKGKDIGNKNLDFGYLKYSSETRQEIEKLIYDKKNLTSNGGWNKDFHTFTIFWEPDQIEFKVDDVSFGVMNVRTKSTSTSLGELDEFYLAFGVGVGGSTFFPDDSIISGVNLNKPWKSTSPRPQLDFWINAMKNPDHWYYTWKDCDMQRNCKSNKELKCPTALQIDYIKVWAL